MNKERRSHTCGAELEDRWPQHKRLGCCFFKEWSETKKKEKPKSSAEVSNSRRSWASFQRWGKAINRIFGFKIIRDWDFLDSRGLGNARNMDVVGSPACPGGRPRLRVLCPVPTWFQGYKIPAGEGGRWGAPPEKGRKDVVLDTVALLEQGRWTRWGWTFPTSAVLLFCEGGVMGWRLAVCTQSLGLFPRLGGFGVFLLYSSVLPVIWTKEGGRKGLVLFMEDQTKQAHTRTRQWLWQHNGVSAHKLQLMAF